MRPRAAVPVCPCGRPARRRSGLCRRCSIRRRDSRRRFGGYKEQILERDGSRCRACGSAARLAIHHRRPGVHDPGWLVTVCAGCHARLHRSRALRRWVPEFLVLLWAEQHPGAPVQLQLPEIAA